jgi:hypothetical protein
VASNRYLSGKPLKILEAIKIVPHGVQPGLVPVTLYSQLEVDPLRDDLAVKLVELRSSMKSKSPELAGGLKVVANSAAFGIFSQLDVKSLDSRSPLHVFSGQTDYLTPPAEIWERPSEFYCPVISSLVTGASHLLCAMLERTVRDMGGQIAAMDTDSAMIVSTKDGGFVPCAGGPQDEPRDFGVTRELALAHPGSWVGSLFICDRPQIGFSLSEQRLLRAAIALGGTDEEISDHTGISLFAVKKTWRSIYDRVQACFPQLLSTDADGLNMAQGRGKEKKQHVLAYLREHPEELRPFSRPRKSK